MSPDSVAKSRLLCTILLLFMQAILFPWQTASAQPALRIATEGAYPPFNYVNEDGRLAGFDVDIAKALCEVMERKCTLQAVAWDDILPGLSKNNYDVIIASMARTPQREEIADFTNYYYRSRSIFAGNPTKPFIQTREGMKGCTVGVQTGTVQEAYLRSNYDGTALIKTALTMNEIFAMLVSGEVDTVLSDGLTIYDFLQTSAGQPFDIIGSPLPADDPSSRACIAVAKGNTSLVNALNKAIREIKLNGTYDKINEKYFPFSIY